MNRLLGFAALTGLVLAAVAHVCALAGIDVAERVPSVWLLHIGVFVVFIPFVFSSRKVLGKHPSLADMRALVPGRVFAVGLAVFIYAIINFVLFAVATQGGNPVVEAGQYLLKSHGHLIRELSRPEYERCGQMNCAVSPDTGCFSISCRSPTSCSGKGLCDSP
jgi:hypothetical protein